MKKSNLLPFLFAYIIFVACNPSFRTSSVQYNNYNVQQKGSSDSEVYKLIKSYSDSVNKSMNDVLGINESLLEKKAGMSTLGYFMADAFLFMAKQKFKTNVDIALINHGGIRLNEMPPGKVTRGKLFELMPFDNLLVLQIVNGKILKQYLDTLAQGEAVNIAGITMSVKNQRTSNVLVGGKPLDENADYVMANSEYSINNSELLKSISMKNIGYLQRDALIDYVILLNKQGKKIVVENPNRVSYAQ